MRKHNWSFIYGVWRAQRDDDDDVHHLICHYDSFFLFERHVAADPEFTASVGLTSSYGQSRSDELQETVFFFFFPFTTWMSSRVGMHLCFLPPECPNTNCSRLILSQQVAKPFANVVQNQLSSDWNSAPSVFTLHKTKSIPPKKQSNISLKETAKSESINAISHYIFQHQRTQHQAGK